MMARSVCSTEPEKPTLELVLYVAGDAPNSVAARANLQALLAAHAILAEVEVVDVLSAPKRGIEDGILVTPTLLKLRPAPPRTIIGNLSELPAVLAALGLGG